ncbi:MAG: discoidin domain-containing protein, partial [Bacteroidaceae bacterium]
MKRKFISFLTFVALAVAGTLPASAQYDPTADGFDPDTKLILTETQLASPASDQSEGTHIEYLIDDNVQTFWHSDWHGSYSGAHYIQVNLIEETTGYYQMVFGRRHNSNTCQPTQMLVEQSADGQEWSEVKSLELPWAGDDDQGKYVVSGFFRLSAANYIRVTCTKTNTNTKTWHCAELQFYAADEAAALAGAIDDLLTRYDRYLPGYPEELNIGSGFGQYSDTQAWENFQAHMATAEEYAQTLFDGGEVSKEQINEIVTLVEADYKAIMASLVTFSMADGYYRIVGGLKYYTEEETGETDLDGNPLTKKNYYDIAMFGTLDGWCYWGAKDNTDARQLWRLSMVGKDIKMVNAATEMQCAGMKDGAISMSAEVDTLMGFDYVATNENGKDIFYIRYATSPVDYGATASTYFHQWGHGKGNAQEVPHKLCMWQATWNKGEEYTGDKGTSEWYLEPVSEEEVQALLEAYDLVKNHDKLVLNYQEYIAKAEAALDVAKDLRNVYSPDTEKPVITSTSQFHSLWTEPNEGSLDNLLDNDPNTFWHSAWSSGKATGPHQASLDVIVDEPL